MRKKVIWILLAIGAIALYFYIYNMRPLIYTKECPYQETKAMPTIEDLPEEARIAYEIMLAIDFKLIADEWDYWQAPFESSRKGKKLGHEAAGDCEDATFYLIEKLTEKGIIATAVIGKLSYTTALFGPGHMWTRVIVVNSSGEEVLYDLDMTTKRIWRSYIEEEMNIGMMKRYWRVMRRQWLWKELKDGLKK